MAIIKGRRQAHPDKAFALFLIGMRVNRLAAIGQWWPVASAMPRIQKELAGKPEAGMLWQKNFFSGRITLALQYWAGMERLFAYALTPEACENIYRDMPAFGLGAAIGTVPATARMGGFARGAPEAREQV